MSLESQVEQLRSKLSLYEYHYHVLSEPLVSDEVYDTLYAQLKKLEHDHPQFIVQESPTQRIGSLPLSGFKTIKHKQKMMSLENAFGEKDMVKFFDRIKRHADDITCIAEPKIDGVAVSLIYEDGILRQAITRGDGQAGEDVTANVRTIKTCPLVMREPTKGTMTIRGEVFISKVDFATLNQNLKEAGFKPYANPRNLASGSLRQLDSAITATRRLKLFCYDVVGNTSTIKSHYEMMVWLKNQGFLINPYMTKVVNGEWQSIYEKLDSERAQLDYDIDGIVFKLNDYRFYDLLGVTSKFPKWAIALKFPSKKAMTKLNGIEWQLGRTGVVTPVAQLEPVQLAGVTISSASLHNSDEIKRLGIKIHDHVVVARAGDVIPEVCEVVDSLRTGSEIEIVVPTYCPSCGTLLQRDGEVALRCNAGWRCAPQLEAALWHALSRNALNVDGVGRQTITAMVESDLVKNVGDIYRLTKDQWLSLPRMGEKSANNIMRALAESKKTSLQRFIYAIGIRHVGLTTAGTIADAIGSVDKLCTLDPKSLEDLHDVGPAVSLSWANFFGEKSNCEFIEAMLQCGFEVSHEKVKGDLSGWVVVITGKLDKPRNWYQERFRAKGARVVSSVSKAVTHGVIGHDAGGKQQQLLELGVQILTDQACQSLLD